ncbi:alpha/beta hydrolase [Brevibacterium linens]|uniref:alpha/beta hydrolase n=1 Tax=Brevibacterium linens TaxID=1703 RepID=UPI003BF4FAC3
MNSQHPSGTHGERSRQILRRIVIVLLIVAALFQLLAQVLAIVPVAWTGGLLQNPIIQIVILLSSRVRDQLGGWNIVVSLVIVVALLLLLRTGRIWKKTVLLSVASASVALALITSAGVAMAMHEETGRLPTPFVPFANPGQEPNETVVFGHPGHEPLSADLYLPETQDQEASPLVIKVHGGGFVAGSRGTDTMTSSLVDSGFAVLDVDYRLATEDLHTWDRAVADIGCAMNWAAANSEKYSWDPDRFATLGDSAGGNLAINAAYMANSTTLTPSCGQATDVPQIQATIGFFPAVDLVAAEKDSGIGALAGARYIGGSPEEFPERYVAAGSHAHIDKRSPPTLVIQGASDHLVLPAPVERFTRALAKQGIDHRYIEIPFTDHAFISHGVNPAIQIGREVTLSWLDGYIP